MSLPRIVFLDRGTIPQQIRIPTLAREHHWQEYPFTQPSEVVERIQQADIVITNKVVLSAAILEQCPQVKLIAVSATGVNNVDIDYCQQRQIAVTNIQGYATGSVPEHIIGMLFTLRRNLMGYHNDIANGEWQRNKQFCFFTHPIGDIAGSTMGIIGSGSLGQATAALAKAIGMKVIFAERKGALQCRDGYVPFAQLIKQADVISLHCPLTPQTHNLIAEPELNMMKSSAILLNAGRGCLVDEQALVNALQAGDIAGAGVDVFTQEPADDSNPLLAQQKQLSNLLLTPHVAWGSDSALKQLSAILIANIDAYLRGESQNRIV